APPPDRAARARLQRKAPPMTPELASSVILEELGDAPERVFARWDPLPFAAASIGQVHRAITRDGRAVAVKVQYPGIARTITSDVRHVALLRRVAAAAFPGLDTRSLIDELGDRLREEVDYRLEGENQELFARYYEDHPVIHVPHVVSELSTTRVLTSELVAGMGFDDVLRWNQDERNMAGETINRFVSRSLYRLHAFNGDPHPGNYLFHGGGQVTFLDFGLVKRFTPAEIDMFERMAQALVVRRDGGAYRTLLEEAAVLKPGSGMTEEQIIDYFGYYYDPVMEDRDYTFTLEYASKAMEKLLPVGPGASPQIRRFGNLPPAFAILQRINVGMTAVMAHLDATANWRRIG